jgi:DNA-binding CsgD family transcriptional regulator
MKNKKIEEATIDELINGYVYGYLYNWGLVDKTKGYICLFCNKGFDEDGIYTVGKLTVNAKKAVRLHIDKEHGHIFRNLLALDKNKTGLTDTQKDFLECYYSGMNDKEIAEKMNISAATVRYQRFNFREKVKQARMILALSELLDRELELWGSPKPIDENQKMLETLFESLSPLKLKTFDFKKKREEKRQLILKTVIQQFEKEKKYTNKEVDAVLKEIYHDYATLRRHLVDYGFLERTGDCREYWVNENK